MTLFSSDRRFSFSVEVSEFFSWSWAEVVFHFFLWPQAPDGFTECLVLIITLSLVNFDGDVGWYIPRGSFSFLSLKEMLFANYDLNILLKVHLIFAL